MTKLKRVHSRKHCVKRRIFIHSLWFFALLYPIMKYMGYAVPRKPVFVKITTPMPQAGFLLTSGFILFDKDDKCWALSRKCTHLGCKIHYSETRKILECPCHQSQFDHVTGKVIKGPAERSLTQLPVEKRLNSPYYVVTT
ncbi:MAG: Rieske (2Fe-2S) protein [Deltaproteobacteria bacterium]|nr:Rieske (2Fe-2S) protein [Deltaproteobacteria bacterium]MBW2658192.1 Rieske (2Fe-2S) protein [Deltaproteobacteria bacterium]